METLTKPEMVVRQVGDKYKILNVSGAEGAQMPLHITTKEAVIIVLQGEAILKLQNREIHLRTNDSAIIPAQAPHTLQIEKDFEANVIMEIDSEIKFIN